MKTGVKLTVERYTAVPPNHILSPDAPFGDRLIVHVRQNGWKACDLRLAVPCRTFASEAAEVSVPYILPGFYADAYLIGEHGRGRNRRDALVNQGFTPVALRRANGTEVATRTPFRSEDWRGINIHDWRGDSNGCITLLPGDMEAVLDLCRFAQDRLPLEGVRRHRDGRVCWHLELLDYTNRTRSTQLPD